MKALVLVAAFAALTSAANAGATRDAQSQPTLDTRAATVVADAGRYGSASLTALNGSRWTPQPGQAEERGESPATSLVADVDGGTLVIGLGLLALALARPLGRAIRRQERQRRAAALASTLHAPRH